MAEKDKVKLPSISELTSSSILSAPATTPHPLFQPTVTKSTDLVQGPRLMPMMDFKSRLATPLRLTTPSNYVLGGGSVPAISQSSAVSTAPPSAVPVATPVSTSASSASSATAAAAVASSQSAPSVVSNRPTSPLMPYYEQPGYRTPYNGYSSPSVPAINTAQQVGAYSYYQPVYYMPSGANHSPTTPVVGPQLPIPQPQMAVAPGQPVMGVPGGPVPTQAVVPVGSARFTVPEVIDKPANKCHRCGTTETPEWRRGPNGVRTLCNACGLFHAKLVKRKGAVIAAEEVLNNKVTKGKNGRRISIQKHLQNESIEKEVRRNRRQKEQQLVEAPTIPQQHLAHSAPPAPVPAPLQRHMHPTQIQYLAIPPQIPPQPLASHVQMRLTGPQAGQGMVISQPHGLPPPLSAPLYQYASSIPVPMVPH